MSEHGRNIIVGFFVLLGLAVLAYLIVKFQSTVGLFTGRGDYYIEIQADQTAAVLPGQAIHLNGKPVGRIRSVDLAEDPRKGVIIIAAINQQYSIPDDVKKVFIYQGEIGPPFIQIRALPSHSAVPMKKTAGEVVATLKAHIPPGPFSEISSLAVELKPALKELAPALAKIGALADNLSAMLLGPENGATEPANGAEVTRVNLGNLARKFSQTLDNLNAFIGDEENKENFKQSLVNLRQAGQDASEALEELKGFSGQAQQTTSELGLQLRDVAQAIIGNSERISELLTRLNKAAEQINQGRGTAGKILYDPQLYEEMLLATEQLNEALQMFRNLLTKWNKQGLKLDW
ncbi:MAG: MCE family protein [Phycisphaerae bacterium]|nr:MCE family protein [Phycisphaerae bacterium]